ncbi:MAG: class I SAM-dependent methyltransferase [Patescibacteria group bacterium]|nr:class I SAM-dependent methyltransferase [Patescibacteria group bacterium]
MTKKDTDCRCPVCFFDQSQLLVLVRSIPIYQCQHCQIGYLDKRGLKKQRKLKSNTFYDFSQYLIQEERLRRRFRKIISLVKKINQNGQVLDVGAGFGLLARELYLHGYQVTAVEPKSRLEYLKGLKVKIFRTSLENFSKKDNYQVIFLIDVLEHFSNLNKALAKIKDLLADGGVVVIQTPNYRSLMTRICRNWSWWFIEEHKLFFNPISLAFLLKKNSFEVIHLETYEDLFEFKKNFDGNFASIKSSWLRKILKLVVYSFFFPCYLVFRPILYRLGFGGLILILAKK